MNSNICSRGEKSADQSIHGGCYDFQANRCHVLNDLRDRIGVDGREGVQLIEIVAKMDACYLFRNIRGIVFITDDKHFAVVGGTLNALDNDELHGLLQNSGNPILAQIADAMPIEGGAA